jgi:hypothetical protein
MGNLSRSPQEPRRVPGIAPNLISPIAPAQRKTTHEVISGYRETAVIDTPMRKFSVLETQDGDILLRDIDFTLNSSKATVTWVHLERAQSLTLAAVLQSLDDAAPSVLTKGIGKRP